MSADDDDDLKSVRSKQNTNLVEKDWLYTFDKLEEFERYR